MDLDRARAIVEKHGAVLQSARGRVPSLAEEIAGERIRGSWWSHPRGREIFAIVSALAEDENVLFCRLVEGKVTLVHRRLWPALARLAPQLDAKRTCRIVQVHTDSGHHETREQPFPDWAPPDVLAAAAKLDDDEARRQLGAALAR
jgi:hypothetical protein